MSSLSGSVRPKRARRGQCPICAGDGCAIWRSGGVCRFCVAGVWRGRTCRFCAGTGERQATIICRRVQSAHATKSGNGWIHSPDAETLATLPPPKNNILPLASIEERHFFYSALLDSLPLYDEHFQHLNQIRGLSEDSIANAQFKSVPSRFDGDKYLQSVTRTNPGIPGVFTVQDRLCLHLTGLDGFYIPIRDEHGRIQALQVRQFSTRPKFAKYLMLGGAPKEWMPRACAGTPNHFLRFDASSHCVLVVEGILKSEIVAEYAHLIGLRCPIVACVGTGSYGEMGAQLKRLMPGLRVAFTAFDWDAPESKGAVDTALRRERLHRQFAEAGVRAEAVEWDGVKGFDDYLLKRAKG